LHFVDVLFDVGNGHLRVGEALLLGVVTRTARAVTPTTVTRHILFERVLDLLASLFEAGLRLVGLALIFSALVARDLADRFFGLTDKVFGLVLCLVHTAHSVCSSPSRVAERPARGYLTSQK